MHKSKQQGEEWVNERVRNPQFLNSSLPKLVWTASSLVLLEKGGKLSASSLDG
jgi:hypothetical protein